MNKISLHASPEGVSEAFSIWAKAFNVTFPEIKSLIISDLTAKDFSCKLPYRFWFDDFDPIEVPYLIVSRDIPEAGWGIAEEIGSHFETSVKPCPCGSMTILDCAGECKYED